MSFARDRDLERWEQGELSTSDLVALHGSDGAAGMVVLHRRMSALRTSPVGDPETVWRAISERLPTAGGQRQTAPFRRRLTRPLAIAAAAVLIAGTAYAGSPDSVHRYLTSFWHTVQSILDVDVRSDAPADAERPLRDGGPGGEPVAGVGDADDEDPNGDEANEDESEPGDSSTVRDDAEDEQTDEDENGSGDEEEGIGGNDQGGNRGDDAGQVEDDGDKPSDDEIDEDDPRDDENDPSGSGGGEDEADAGDPGGDDDEAD
jgi:hypothetical protein